MRMQSGSYSYIWNSYGALTNLSEDLQQLAARYKTCRASISGADRLRAPLINNIFCDLNSQSR